MLKSLKNKNTPHVFAVTLFVLAIFSIILHFNDYSDLERCYFYNERHLSAIKRLGRNITILEDITKASYRPDPEFSIFFIETSCRNLNEGIANLTLRQACAVESSARINNETDVFVLFASPVYLADEKTPAAIKTILSYPNVHLNNINPWTITKGTPFEKWFRKGQLFKCHFPSKALKDYLKLIFLWRWGGTFIDLDTISMRPAPQSVNFIANETDLFLSATIMNFDVNGIGHKFIVRCLKKFELFINSDYCYATGRELLTLVMREMCYNAAEICAPIKFLHRTNIFPFNGESSSRLFLNLYNYRLLSYISNFEPYVIYLGNQLCLNCKSSLNNPGVYGLFAAKNCPKVYSLASEFF